jgi:hypothetical protein
MARSLSFLAAAVEEEASVSSAVASAYASCRLRMCWYAVIRKRIQAQNFL